MAINTFYATNVTATTDFQTLASLLGDAGIAVTNGAVALQDGYIKNNSTTVNLRIGVGTTEPTTYVTVPPYTAILFLAGLNANLVWLRSASSTVSTDFVEGAANYVGPTVNGIIGNIGVTAGQVPMGDSGGDLVASSISDDGTTATVDEDFEVTGDTALDGNLDVTGDAAVGGDATVTGTLDVTGIVTTTAATNLGAEIAPTSNDGVALGDATHNFSDLFLASGALINYANGNMVLTHSSGILTASTGDIRVTTAGTNSASVVTVGGAQTLTSKGLTTPTLNGGAALGATSTEIDQLNDVSAYTETVAAAGAISVTKVVTNLEVASGGAVTLAAPSATMLGQVKTIQMTVDDGDTTLALTNVVGQSSGTTATFNDAGDALIVLALASKWLVIKEFGVTLS